MDLQIFTKQLKNYLPICTKTAQKPHRVPGSLARAQKLGFALLLVLSLYLDGRTQNMAALVDRPRSGPDSWAMLDSADLGSFTKGYFENKMHELGVPGAVILILKDGRVLFKAGYGYANLAQKLPADPDRTLFRIGSITKLFTSTAIMQLTERSSLRIDSKVNDFLTAFKVKGPGATTLTLGDLLRHTAGFDNHNIGRYARTPAAHMKLGDYLDAYLPDLVSRPGEVISYCNFGITLAGYLIQEVSGQSYEEFIRRSLLRPLDMSKTRFLDEVDGDGDSAMGYRSDGAVEVVAEDYPNLVPSGALVSTASDMAAFMQMHLQNGRYQDQIILQPRTTAIMHARQVGLHPALPGWCYGFYESFRNGRRAIMHSGQSRGFSSVVYLMKEQRIGIFIAYNSNQTALWENYLDAFHQRYFPASHAGFAPHAHLDGEKLEKLTGSYRLANGPQATLAKFAEDFVKNADVTVSLGPDQTLFVHMPEETLALQEVGTRLFQDRLDQTKGYFTASPSGRGQQMHLVRDRIVSFKKISWWESLSWQINMMRAFIALFLVLAGASLLQLARRGPNNHVVLTLGISGLNLLFLLGINRWDFSQLRYGISTDLVILLTLPLVAAALLIFQIMAVFKMISRQGFSKQSLLFSATSFTFLAFVGFLHYWNLLGFCY